MPSLKALLLASLTAAALAACQQGGGTTSSSAGASSPTAPYSTAQYDATTLLPCSLGAPTHDQSCPAGVLRGDAGSATVYVMRSDGVERILVFESDDVVTSGPGTLTWGKDGDMWYIGIDDNEFYKVADAVIYGG